MTADSDVIHSSSLPYFHDNKLFQHGCTALNTGVNTCMCGAQTDLLHTVCKRVCRLVIYAPHSSSYSANHTLHSQESQHALHLFALNVIKCLIHVIFVNRLVILQIRKKKKSNGSQIGNVKNSLMKWVVPVTKHTSCWLKLLNSLEQLCLGLHSATLLLLLEHYYFFICKVRGRCEGEEDGRPSAAAAAAAAAAADVRAPLEAVELQTEDRFGGTPADVSGGERRAEETRSCRGKGMTCEPSLHRYNKLPKVWVRQGRVDARRDLTQVNERPAARPLSLSVVFFFLVSWFPSPRLLSLLHPARRQGAAGTGGRQSRCFFVFLFFFFLSFFLLFV